MQKALSNLKMRGRFLTKPYEILKIFLLSLRKNKCSLSHNCNDKNTKIKSAFEKVLEYLRIRYIRTVPYSPCQNSIVEEVTG